MMHSSRPRPWTAHVDMYRKIPTDLMEGSRRGSILSQLSLLVMVILFFMETKAFFFSGKLVTDLAMDVSGEDKRIRLNFNITMMDLKCDWAVIDVVSVLGTDQNVTAHEFQVQQDLECLITAGSARRSMEKTEVGAALPFTSSTGKGFSRSLSLMSAAAMVDEVCSFG